MLTLGPALHPHRFTPLDQPARLDPFDLARHAVCVGMTGSGKTGLCVGLLEAVARAGVPVLALDPKGDLGNLALVLDPQDPATFEPWVPPPTGGTTVAEAARAAAAAWGAALAADGVTRADLAERRARVEVVVHTPGSTAGVPVDVLGALTRAPPGLEHDPEGLREFATGAVVSLLGLAGHAVDPHTDPRAILLQHLFEASFRAGESLPLEALLPRITDPPFETVGLYPVDQVLSRLERRDLALQLNNLVASPALRSWREGPPLDIEAWMRPGADGRTPIRVLSLSHLDDRQRQFFVSLLLHAVVAWTRRLPGVSELRGVIYFDEVMGYLPPHPKDPPTKGPVLTLLKQARAVGVGVVLCTQNPVDVDYKALSNAATWFVGRLQTRQDRQRVVDGLTSAQGDVDPDEIDDVLGRLPRRTFVVRSADRPEATVFRTRQVTCWLRGPLTRREISRLQVHFPPGVPTPLPDAAPAPPPPDPSPPPVGEAAPGGVEAAPVGIEAVPVVVEAPPVEVAPTDAGALVAPAVPSLGDDPIERVYLQIRALQRTTLLELMVRIGRLLVETFFDGDLEQVHRRAQKDASLRRLAARFAADPDTGLTRSGLFRAIAAYELHERHGLVGRRLTLSHLDEVRALPEAQQAALLDAVEADDLTVRQLRERVKGEATADAPGDDDPPVVRTVRTVHRAVTRQGALEGLDDLTALSPAEVAALREAVTAIAARLDLLEDALRDCPEG